MYKGWGMRRNLLVIIVAMLLASCGPPMTAGKQQGPQNPVCIVDVGGEAHIERTTEWADYTPSLGECGKVLWR